MAKKKEVKEVTELVIIPEFSEVVSSTKIELTKAQQHALAFQPLMQQYHEISLDLSKINKENPTKECVKIAYSSRQKLVKVRTATGAIKDTRKETIKLEDSLIMNLHNTIINTCKLTEAEFKEIEDFAENKENERLDKLEEERRSLLSAFGEINKFTPIRLMDEETFDEYLKDQKLLFEAKERQLADQKKADDLAAEKEKTRLADLQKSEDERKARESLYQDRLKELLGDGFTMSGDDLTHGNETYFNVSDLGTLKKKEYDSIRKSGLTKITAENKANAAKQKAVDDANKIKEQEAQKVLDGQYQNRCNIARLHLINLGFSEYPENEFMKHDAIGTIIPWNLYDKLDSDELLNEFCTDCSTMMSDAIETIKKAEARKNELAPDKDKIIKYANEFNDLAIAEMKTKEGKAAKAIIDDAIKALKSVIKEQYNKLK